MLITNLQAQNRFSDSTKLFGFVISENDSDFCPLAKVEILELHLECMTDIDGKFIFNNVPPDSYTLRISSMGMDTTLINSLVIPHMNQPLIIMHRFLGFCHDAADQARADLARGRVHLRAGGLKAIFLPAQKQLEQIDKKYGIQWDDTGCSGNCDKEYNSIVMIYLNLRNGKGWWDRYQDEVKNVYESFRHK